MVSFYSVFHKSIKCWCQADDRQNFLHLELAECKIIIKRCSDAFLGLGLDSIWIHHRVIYEAVTADRQLHRPNKQARPNILLLLSATRHSPLTEMLKTWENTYQFVCFFISHHNSVWISSLACSLRRRRALLNSKRHVFLKIYTFIYPTDRSAGKQSDHNQMPC